MNIKHEGIYLARLDPKQGNPREVAFAEQWKHENDKHGFPVLDALIPPTGRFNLDQETAEIAATIIQWLGSNVGFSFLRTALDKCGFKIVEKDSK